MIRLSVLRAALVGLPCGVGAVGHGRQGYGRRMSRPKDWPEGWSRDGGPSKPPRADRRLCKHRTAPRERCAACPSSAAAARGRRRGADPGAATHGGPVGAASVGGPAGRAAAARHAPAAAFTPTAAVVVAGSAGRWPGGCRSSCCSSLALLGIALLSSSAHREGRRGAGLRRAARRRRPGTNWLIVGSDSREGLSDEEVKDLRLGKVEGRRTDTIILLHRPESGKPTLVSLPRDSYVPIPGHGPQQAERGIRLRRAVAARADRRAGDRPARRPLRRGRIRRLRRHDRRGRRRRAVPEAQDPRPQERASGAEGLPGDGRPDRARVRPGAVLRPARATSAGSSASRSSSARCSTRPQPDDAAEPVPHRVARQRGHHGPDDRRGRRTVSLVQFALTMRAVAGGGGKRVTVPVADPNYSTPAGAPPFAGTASRPSSCSTPSPPTDPAAPRSRPRKRDRRALRMAHTPWRGGRTPCKAVESVSPERRSP